MSASWLWEVVNHVCFSFKMMDCVAVLSVYPRELSLLYVKPSFCNCSVVESIFKTRGLGKVGCSKSKGAEQSRPNFISGMRVGFKKSQSGGRITEDYLPKWFQMKLFWSKHANCLATSPLQSDACPVQRMLGSSASNAAASHGCWLLPFIFQPELDA